MTKANAATQPVKAGEVPANIMPHITFQQAMDVAATKIDALLRGGVECITFISSAFLVGYLANASQKVKMNVMRDEFALALGKKGLGGTQTKKYLDYAFKLSGIMFKECQYGHEVGELIAATTPDKAHVAVKRFLERQTKGKKTEHGTPITDAAVKINTLGIFLKLEDDPGKEPPLEGTPEFAKAAAEKQAKAQKSVADRISKDPGLLQKVEAGKLVDTVAKVVSFDTLIVRHIASETKADALEKEMETVIAAYKARIKELRANLGAKTGKVETRKERKAA